MFSRKADLPLQVQIPRAVDDHPSWTRVGIIAAVGFLVGIAWPRLAGVRLGPSLPADAPSAVAAATAAPVDTTSGSVIPTAPAMAAVPAVAASSAPSALGPPPPAVAVGHAVIFACKTTDGDSLKGGDCGTLPGIDGIVMPRLRNLSDCPDAVGANGKLHLVLHIDFSRGSLLVDLGRGNGVASPDALLVCAKGAIQGANLVGVPHDNPRYSVAYSVTFAPGEGVTPAAGATPGAASALASTAADDGSAQVVWEVGIVRDAPKSGKVVARLQRGTTIHVGAPRDGWYPVKFGDGFTSDGWLYRGAIGK
jgi:hypothetical protein